MRLYAYRSARAAGERWGVLVDGGLYTNRQLERIGGPEPVRSASSWRPSSPRASVAPPGERRRPRPDGRGPAAARSTGDDRSPAIPFPGKIVCVGLNYRDHARGAARSSPPTDRCSSPSSPTRSSPTASRSSGRPATHALDLEAELGVVIGRRASRVAAGRRDGPRRRLRRRSTTSRPATGRASSRRSARASTATASGSGPRARTRSSRSARSS